MGYRIIESGDRPGRSVVTKVRITEGPRAMPDGILDKIPELFVTIDGKEKCMFSFFPDEISFTEEELMGLTEREVMQLHLEKDKQFLQEAYSIK
jgi:hypothetical protein